MITEESRLTQIGESYLKYTSETSNDKRRYALYQCSCGNTKEAKVYAVETKETKSCGCLYRKKPQDFSILENNMLTQIGEPFHKFVKPTSKYKTKFALYKCDCGNTKEIRPSDVEVGKIVSCGCYNKSKNIEMFTKHGLSDHRLYVTWHHMIARCTKETNDNYGEYGGRGIKVCARWMKLENFIEDMNSSHKEGLTLDRINTDGNYEPKNCRWATQNTQNRNTRKLVSTNTSGYRGVSLDKRRNVWVTRIVLFNKAKHLGQFKTALEGAKAYDTYVIQNNLEHTINGVLFSDVTFTLK